MSLSAATSDAIGVLIADSNRMQAQLLTSALRRHPEFHLTTCLMDTMSIAQAVIASLPRVALLSVTPATLSATVAVLRRLHLSHPESRRFCSPTRLIASSWSQRFAREFEASSRSPTPTFACFANVSSAWPVDRYGSTPSNSTT